MREVGSGGILFFLEGFFSRGAIDVGARGKEPIVRGGSPKGGQDAIIGRK